MIFETTKILLRMMLKSFKQVINFFSGKKAMLGHVDDIWAEILVKRMTRSRLKIILSLIYT